MNTLAHLIDPAAIAIVGGGTILAVVLRTPLRDLVRALAALKTLGRARLEGDALLQQIAALGRIAQRHGAMALDRTVIADPERHVAAAEVWAGAAEVAPAMGMVGTLIGLARMFATMSDPTAIGGAMAIALLATLYGALLANLVFMPIANRLRAQGRNEAFERARIEAPLVALAAREAPRAPLMSVA
jgi:chemotaxis protein MotA